MFPETVANASNGFNDVAVGTKLAAQRDDVNIDCAVGGVGFMSGYRFKNLLTAKHPTWAPGEKM
jgi:hypothetical protein